jgi:zinc protease
MPKQGSDEDYALQMLTTLLSTGESSRFYKELVDDQQIAMAVFAFPFSLESGGLFITLGLANVGNSPEDLEKSMEAEIEKVKSELISDTEYQKLQNQMENAFVNDNSTVAGVAESLADYHVFYGDANLINNEIERYMAVTKEEIMAVAQKYLVPENRVVLYYLPKSAQQQPENSEIKKEGN